MKRSATFAVACTTIVLSVPAHANNDVPGVRRGHSGIPELFQTCMDLNRKYHHGVGRAGARDRTSGEAVTTFKRSTKIYRLALSYNRGLDHDRDGIACEKA